MRRKPYTATGPIAVFLNGIFMYSKTKEGRAEYWKKYRAEKLPYTTKLCIDCGEEYKQDSNVQKRCNKCRQAICIKCGSIFYPQNKTQPHKYCSNVCKNNALKGKEPECLKANRGIKPRTYHLTHRDKRGSAFDREWRIAVFERDNYTCQACGDRGGELNAHHLKPYKKHPELKHDINNGQTLCVECHKKTDSYGWSNYWKKERAAKRLSQEVIPYEYDGKG